MRAIQSLGRQESYQRSNRQTVQQRGEEDYTERSVGAGRLDPERHFDPEHRYDNHYFIYTSLHLRVSGKYNDTMMRDGLRSLLLGKPFDRHGGEPSEQRHCYSGKFTS
ncbi:hypothetical protein AWENTII_011554 [Aspergillus wentii]